MLDIFKQERSLRGAYRRLFESPDGKIVLQNLMRSHFMLRNTVVAGDPNLTHFNEGQRAVVLKILTLLHVDEEHLNTLAKEAIETHE